MNGREFVRRARRYARRNRLTFYFDPTRGKGSHGKLTIGNRSTVVQHNEIPAGTLSAMLRQLDINRQEFYVMRYAFPCNIVLDDEEAEVTGREAYVITFPDLLEAITGAWSWQEALEMAEDCLAVALSFYVNRNEDIPTPGPLADGQILIAVPIIVAAKLTLYTAMREQAITVTDLATKLDMTESAVHNLLDSGRFSHISQIERALKAVGRSLIIEDMGTTLTNPVHHPSLKERDTIPAA